MKGSAFLYPALFKTAVLPPLLTNIGLRQVGLGWNHYLLVIALYLFSWPALFVLRSYWAVVATTYRARQLGARDIPRVKGKWPLNLDILRDWAKSGSEEEVGWMMVLLGRQYSTTYNTRVLGEDQIISTDPAVLKHALLDDFDNFPKGEKFRGRAEDFLGDGIFNSDGERWKFVGQPLQYVCSRISLRRDQHRDYMRPFFHPAHISPALLMPSIKRFMECLPTDRSFDIQTRIGQLALEMSILWLCGVDLSSATGDSEWEKARGDLGDALIQAQRIVGKRVKIGTLWPLFEIGQDPLREPMTTIRAFFAPLIQQAMSKREMSVKQSSSANLIDQMVQATEDTKLIQDQLINILLASRDTTASLLSSLTYATVLHPDTAAKVREEILTTTSSDIGVNRDVIRELRQSRAFINETLRLFPPVPLNIRRTLRPSLLPSSSGGPPLYMPGNTSIILNFVLMQRDPRVWGANAEEFDIDRWKDMGKEREAFMSWNYGPRMCLGQPLALAIAHTFLVLLHQHLAGLGNTSIALATAAQPPNTQMPDQWRDAVAGDGRARGGRDRAWIVSDVVLAFKGGLWVQIE